MSTILAKKIYQNSQLIFDNNVSSPISSEMIGNTPKQAWLQMNPYCCGGPEQWQLTFKQPASLINVLTGVWIEIGAMGFLIDGNVADVGAKLNGCCGSNAVITQNYGSGLPAYQAPTTKTYTVTRSDDGTIAAQIDAELAYVDSLIPNSFSRTGYNTGTGVATYVFQSYKDPTPKGTDTIVETARVFTSNVAPTLTGGNVFNVSGVADGIVYSVRTAATTLANAVIALQADPVAGQLGTWSVVSTTIQLSTTVIDVATVVLGQIA